MAPTIAPAAMPLKIPRAVTRAHLAARAMHTLHPLFQVVPRLAAAAPAPRIHSRIRSAHCPRPFRGGSLDRVLARWAQADPFVGEAAPEARRDRPTHHGGGRILA